MSGFDQWSFDFTRKRKKSSLKTASHHREGIYTSFKLELSAFEVVQWIEVLTFSSNWGRVQVRIFLKQIFRHLIFFFCLFVFYSLFTWCVVHTGCPKSSFLYFISLYFSTIELIKQIIEAKVVSFNLIHYFHTCCAIFWLEYSICVLPRQRCPCANIFSSHIFFVQIPRTPSLFFFLNITKDKLF